MQVCVDLQCIIRGACVPASSSLAAPSAAMRKALHRCHTMRSRSGSWCGVLSSTSALGVAASPARRASGGHKMKAWLNTEVPPPPPPPVATSTAASVAGTDVGCSAAAAAAAAGGSIVINVFNAFSLLQPSSPTPEVDLCQFQLQHQTINGCDQSAPPHNIKTNDSERRWCRPGKVETSSAKRNQVVPNTRCVKCRYQYYQVMLSSTKE